MISYSENDKRKIIMDYYTNPRSRIEKKDIPNYNSKYLHSSSCVDEITLYYDNDKKDWKFVGQGCAIFLSSSEIFIERIKEIGFENKMQLIENYEKLINFPKSIDSKEKYLLEKLMIFENVNKHLNRKECALIISNIFKMII